MWGRALLPVQRGEALQLPKALITPTKTKTKAPVGTAIAAAQQPVPPSPPLPPVLITPSRTSPNSSPAAARSSPSRKHRSKSPPASADSGPARRFATQNMVKERSTSAKEKAKKPRLRYNSLASD